MATIRERVQAVRERLQKQWTWQCLSIGLILGGLLGCLLGAVRFGLSGNMSWAWIGIVLVAAPVAGALWATAKAYTIDVAARMIDRNCGMKDRTQSALQFLSCAEDSPVRRLQIADTEDRLKKIDPAVIVPVKAPSSWLWGLAFTAAAVLLAFISNPVDQASASLASNDVVVSQAVRVEASIEELKRIQEEQRDPELEKLLKEMAIKIDELKQAGLEPKEALAKLSEMEEAMQDMQKQVSDPQTESQLQEIGKTMSLSEAMSSAGQALAKGDLEKAVEELSKLELPELDRQTEKAVIEKLDQLKETQCEGANKKQLKESLGQICEGLGQGDRSKFKDGTNGLASECKKQSQRKKLSDLLRKQCQCLGECKGECESECKSTSDSKKKGGNNWGLARSGNEPGEKTAKLKTNPKMNITGQDSGQGDVDIETSQAPEQAQEAVRQYQQNAKKYEALSESALESESIPLGHRQTIRRYFEMIRPTGTEADSAQPTETKP